MGASCTRISHCRERRRPAHPAPVRRLAGSVAPAAGLARDHRRRVADLERFHQEMGALDGPMVVVTVSAGEQRAGCLVGFHTQVSIDPARYLVCLSDKNHTYRVAKGATHLAVHFLGAEQLDLATRFGTLCSATSDKFEGLALTVGPGGAPIVEDCAHWFVGEIQGSLPIHDHVAFALEPVASGGATDRRRLLGFQAAKHLDAGHAP